MSETMTNQPETGITTPAAEGKTFTQEDVNKIVQDRLAREKTKADAALADREKELAARELQLSAREKLAAKGLPAELMEALNISSTEALDASIAIIEKLQQSQPQGRPTPAKFKTGGEHHEPAYSDEGSVRSAMGLN